MSAKARLKAAKSAIDNKKWGEAKEQVDAVLEKDPQNYFAKLFLGRALDGLGKFDESAHAYEDATKIKPDDAQAWLGLRSIYEKQASEKVDENTKVGLRLAEIYARSDDAHRSQSAVDKLVDFARKHGTKLQYSHALKTQLPTSPVYPFLEGRFPSPSAIYIRLAEVNEEYEAERIAKLIGARRARLGATLGNVTEEVKREVYEKSELEDIYENVINWTNDDELRREYEEKLLQRVYDTLMVMPTGKKAAKRDKVMKLAHDMVVIRHPFLLAWEIELEWGHAAE
ncbi:uncharacterized protein BDR25DRAFT_35240 [Lindgomyces ingoldianus]|uniref:Uncharacterized protein n=1 Tax=Lindgomyces ingoldianus TaxID=673940 RepID=A0ACB6QU11_9PLEO|nr:uncharacterized protein BDR25DRAFT_35240 [Lindgomyces ingoldianus]KAF2470489.1 hypothetical protein BDR25DRAFT_35240 [Lindgomyces ingoldianus]